MTELQHVYGEGDHRRRNLKRDFTKFFEGGELRPTATHQVNLVLAAYDFSLPCRRTLDFLERSANLVIGQLKIDCVWNQTSSPVVEYRWLKYPQKTEAINCSPLRCSPHVYYALSMHGDNSYLIFCPRPAWAFCVIFFPRPRFAVLFFSPPIGARAE